MAYLRMTNLLDDKVFYNNNELDNAKTFFDTMRIPGKVMGLASGLLRKFLEQGGVIDPYQTTP